MALYSKKITCDHFDANCYNSTNHKDADLLGRLIIIKECPTLNYGKRNYKFNIVTATKENHLLLSYFKGKCFCDHCYTELLGSLEENKQKLSDIFERQQYQCINGSQNRNTVCQTVLPKEITMDHLYQYFKGQCPYSYMCITCWSIQELEEKVRLERRDVGEKRIMVCAMILICLYIFFPFISYLITGKLPE